MKNYQNYILDDDYFRLLRLNTVNDDNFTYNAYKFQQSLSLYNNANSSMNCVVYHNNLEFISSAQFSYTLKNYYERLCFTSSQIPAYEEWHSFFATKYDNDFLVHTALSTTDTPSLIFAHTLLRNDKYSTIFITVPLTELGSLLELLPDNTFFVIQSTDNQLYALDRSGLIMSDAAVSLDAEDRLVLSEDYVSLTSAPKDQGFTCHLILSKQAMDDRLSSVRKNFLLTLSITLLLGLTGAVLLLYTNYQPVSKLLTKFNVDSADSNEFLSISSTYEMLQKDYYATRMTVQSQNQELMNSWLLSLLKGRIGDDDIRTKKISLALTPGGRIALIGFMIPPSGERNLEYDELLFFIVDNIFQELFAGYTFYHIEDGRFIYYLFNLKEDNNWQDFALDKIDYLCNILNKKWDTALVGIVSELTDNLMACKFLYREIMEGFEQQKVSGGNTVIDTRSMDTWQVSGQVRDIIEQELDTAVKEGDLNTALNVSERIFAAGYKMPFSTQRAYVFDAFTLVLGIFNNYISNPIQQMQAMDHITPLMQASDTNELKNCFTQMLVFVCGEIAQKWHSESKDIVLTVRKYVQKNYTDQSLSVSSIADAVNRNPTYLSRVFKESTGEGLLDYINRCRITKARELMQMDQYTVKEISELVGYANIRAFRRAFAKLVGEIPSKYGRQ